MPNVRSLFGDESGVALAEYALVLGLIAMGSVTALAGVALACSTTWSNSSSAMQTYTLGTPPP